MNDQPLREVLAYHEATKHEPGRYARGPGYLDWDSQPDPFLRYSGAELVPLDHQAPGEEPSYAQVFVEGKIVPRAVERASVSQLFENSLALSAWKEAGPSRWALRVNPSSGNLHPTEGYVVCGPVPGLCAAPMVAHYAPREHALERRANLDRDVWADLVSELPAPALLVGLTSVHWREAWKYGERSFRYCQHDVGHAIAAVSIAAAALGWRATLLDDLPTSAVATLLGVTARHGVEAERAECLIALHPAGTPCPRALPERAVQRCAALSWVGTPGELSPDHVEWDAVERVAVATEKPAGARPYVPFTPAPAGPRLAIDDEATSLGRIVRQRRSAVAFDGHTGITRDGFYQMLRKIVVGPAQVPFNALPWSPRIDLALFVHRVQDLAPGLYFLMRDPARREALEQETHADFAWTPADGRPDGVDLYRLAEGDARRVAEQVSCGQSIAADGCFSLGMIADFEAALADYGAWFYPRLFQECGVIGQVLYLEAEALGIRGTGIGCFFDDLVHQLLGLESRRFQSLYHFTVGGPVEDPRLRTLAPYA